MPVATAQTRRFRMWMFAARAFMSLQCPCRCYQRRLASVNPAITFSR